MVSSTNKKHLVKMISKDRNCFIFKFLFHICIKSHKRARLDFMIGFTALFHFVRAVCGAFYFHLFGVGKN